MNIEPDIKRLLALVSDLDAGILKYARDRADYLYVQVLYKIIELEVI